MKKNVLSKMLGDPYLQLGTPLVLLGSAMVKLSGVWWWWLLLLPYPIFLYLYYRRAARLIEQEKE